MGQTNRNSKIGCATRVESKKVKYPQTLLLKVHYETSVPIVTAGGLVFIAGTWDPFIRAFDIGTGKELWKAQLPAAGHATPMTPWPQRQAVCCDRRRWSRQDRKGAA